MESPGRYANHSETPNTEYAEWDHGGCVLRALVDIGVDEQIFINYGDEYDWADGYTVPRLRTPARRAGSL